MSSPTISSSAATREITVRAFAKINLTLDVFSKRTDGYHGVASVMQAISLHDTIQISTSDAPGVSLTCDGPESEGIPTDASNLVVRAAAKVIGDNSPLGIRIHLHKSVPSQAGLGGGSSDAAATLVGVNTLLELNLPLKQLHELGASLGSDVPFFLYGGTAVARGRGELLSASTQPAPGMWLVIVKPEESVSTGWAYTELDNAPERSSNRGTKRMEEAIAEQEPELVISRMCNDFELPVFAHFPRLAWLHDELMMAGALSARLCGSGSAMFAVVRSEAEARRIAASLRGRYAKVYEARTLTAEESRAI